MGTYFAVLGDIVGSRAHDERASLQDQVRSALRSANGVLPAIQELVPTIGDEFQGLYRDLPAALEATLLVRVILIGRADVRFGVGAGDLVLEPGPESPFGQDGPAWWAARDAIGRAAPSARRRESPQGLRTVFADGRDLRSGRARPARSEPGEPQSPPSFEALVNAYLSCRDELVGGMDERDARLLIALIRGDTRSTAAAAEGISSSAVSQRRIRNGSYAIERATRLMNEAGEWSS
ncbi:MAG: SatD family protein [Actinomycetota bacterium]|nr:SatD family protein [Actinomycetota bacterium]